MEKNPQFELERYMSYMSTDLEQHALQLHRRDVESLCQRELFANMKPAMKPTHSRFPPSPASTAFPPHPMGPPFITRPPWVRPASQPTAVGPITPSISSPFSLAYPLPVFPTNNPARPTSSPRKDSDDMLDEVKVEDLTDMLTDNV